MIELQPGLQYYPSYLDRASQQALVAQVRDLIRIAPLFVPRMPKTGQPFSVRMSNCGALGWVSDETSYRYQPQHPVTGQNWPDMPQSLLDIWQAVAQCAAQPEACLINFYEVTAKMGLHQDRDEQDFSAPVVSVSLGDTCLFRYGGTTRGGKTQSVRLASGDVLVLGGAARLAFHGVDRVMPATSTLLEHGGRINLTMRRVTRV